MKLVLEVRRESKHTFVSLNLSVTAKYLDLYGNIDEEIMYV